MSCLCIPIHRIHVWYLYTALTIYLKAKCRHICSVPWISWASINWFEAPPGLMAPVVRRVSPVSPSSRCGRWETGGAEQEGFGVDPSVLQDVQNWLVSLWSEVFLNDRSMGDDDLKHLWLFGLDSPGHPFVEIIQWMILFLQLGRSHHFKQGVLLYTLQWIEG